MQRIPTAKHLCTAVFGTQSHSSGAGVSQAPAAEYLAWCIDPAGWKLSYNSEQSFISHPCHHTLFWLGQLNRRLLARSVPPCHSANQGSQGPEGRL